MENILTENLLLNISGLGVAALCIFAIIFIVLKFIKAIGGFVKILSNHLDHQTKMQERDIISRDEYTTKFTEMIIEIKNFFKK